MHPRIQVHDAQRRAELRFAIGYTNASWTLKVDLVCEHLGRILGYMDEHGYDTCIPQNYDPAPATKPLLDFSAGYVQRSVHQLPRQGEHPPWSLAMSYHHDVASLRGGPVENPFLKFSGGAAAKDGENSRELRVG